MSIDVRATKEKIRKALDVEPFNSTEYGGKTRDELIQRFCVDFPDQVEDWRVAGMFNFAADMFDAFATLDQEKMKALSDRIKSAFEAAGVNPTDYD